MLNRITLNTFLLFATYVEYFELWLRSNKLTLVGIEVSNEVFDIFPMV